MERISKAKSLEAEQEIKDNLKKTELEKVISEKKAYFEESRIVDYLFATHDGGQALDPIFSGAVFHNKSGGFCDVHLMKFKYTASYREMIEKDCVTGGVNTLGSPGQMREILRYKQDTVESFYPTLIGCD